MSRVMQPLGEQFLYCSPELMCREYFRWRPARDARTSAPIGRKQKGGRDEKRKSS